MPLLQAVHLHRQQFDLLPPFQFIHTIAEIRSNLTNRVTKSLQTTIVHFRERALANQQSRLEVIAAINQNQRLAVIEISQHLLGIVGVSAEVKPQHVDGDSALDDLKSRGPSRG